jgi:hypothetical protein
MCSAFLKYKSRHYSTAAPKAKATNHWNTLLSCCFPAKFQLVMRIEKTLPQVEICGHGILPWRSRAAADAAHQPG